MAPTGVERLAQAMERSRAEHAYLAGALHRLSDLCQAGQRLDGPTTSAELVRRAGAPSAIVDAIQGIDAATRPDTTIGEAAWLAQAATRVLIGGTTDAVREWRRRIRSAGRDVDEMEQILYCREIPAHPNLTDLQVQVMNTLQGKTSREAANVLGISSRTVDKHVQIIARRLGVRGRTAALIALREAGVLSTDGQPSAR